MVPRRFRGPKFDTRTRAELLNRRNEYKHNHEKSQFNTGLRPIQNSWIAKRKIMQKYRYLGLASCAQGFKLLHSCCRQHGTTSDISQKPKLLFRCLTSVVYTIHKTTRSNKRRLLLLLLQAREREKTIGIQPPIDQSNVKEKKPPGSVISIDLCMWSHSEINVSYATKEHTIATTPADQCDKLKPCEFAAASRERARVIEGETIEETRKAQRKPEGGGKVREGVCSYRKPGPWLTARDGTGYSPWVCPRCQRKYC